MSNFGSGFALGLICSDDAEEVDASGYTARIHQLVEENRTLRSEKIANIVLADALKLALFKENPAHPLVAPFEPGKNELRRSVFNKALARALADPSYTQTVAHAEMMKKEPPGNKANPWRAPTDEELVKRADYDKLVAQLAKEQEEHRKTEKDLRQAAAHYCGQTELVNVLSNALHEVSPEDPLVSPFESGDNIVREKIFQKAYQKQLSETGGLG